MSSTNKSNGSDPNYEFEPRRIEKGSAGIRKLLKKLGIAPPREKRDSDAE